MTAENIIYITIGSIFIIIAIVSMVYMIATEWQNMRDFFSDEAKEIKLLEEDKKFQKYVKELERMTRPNE